MERNATAQWTGTLKEGEGRLTTQSGSLAQARFSFPIRFGDERGTNPEELIAAAHAGCFTMGFTFYAESAGVVPRRVETRAELHLELRGGPAITGIHLHLRADVPGLEESRFQALAQQAKETCLVSRLVNAPVTLTAERWVEEDATAT